MQSINQQQHFRQQLHSAKSTPMLNEVPSSDDRLSKNCSLDSLNQEQAPIKNSESENRAKIISQRRMASDASSKSGSHCHSNSDSGLSSLSVTVARMNAISPVSTMSSAAQSESSRASLRSGSIVSSTFEEQFPEEDVNKEEEKMDSGTGTLRKNSRKIYQEEIECERLSKEIFENNDSRLSNLFGKRFSNSLINYLINLHIYAVPSPNQKTLSDYVAGVLDLQPAAESLIDTKGQIDDEEEKESRNNQQQRRRQHLRNPLSPTLLRKRIEQLKESETVSW